MAEAIGMKSLRKAEAAADSSGDVNEAFKNEVATLRSEIASIREKLAERGGEVYEAASRKAGDAADYLQDEASSVAGVVREHPATATALFTLIGAVGFGIGYLVAATATERKDAWYRRYY